MRSGGWQDMARIKICGVVRDEDIEAVNAALPDYIGFVFAESRRRIGFHRAKVLKAGLDPRIKAVGVFVNEDTENIIRLCEAGVIDLIQLHGDENEDYIKKLRYYVSNEIIKAVRVRTPPDAERAAEYSCDYLLFDAYDEKAYGGVGKTFDWSAIPYTNKPFFLAGGINSGNITRALELCDPYCIDVSSGAETNGYKDRQKIIDIVSKVRMKKIQNIVEI